MSEKKLNGRVALITGASKGLGKAMALALASAGAKLALASRNADQLNAVAKEAQAAGGGQDGRGIGGHGRKAYASPLR